MTSLIDSPENRMFLAAIESLAQISVALDIPDDEASCANGNTLILDRMSNLRTALAASQRENEQLREFVAAVMGCRNDTCECEYCGGSTPWWENSNADYLTRKVIAALNPSAAEKAHE